MQSTLKVGDTVIIQRKSVGVIENIISARYIEVENSIEPHTMYEVKLDEPVIPPSGVEWDTSLFPKEDLLLEANKTGIKDKRGEMIFAGDLVEIPGSDWAMGVVVKRKIWVVDIGGAYAPLKMSPKPMLWQLKNWQDEKIR